MPRRFTPRNDELIRGSLTIVSILGGLLIPVSGGAGMIVVPLMLVIVPALGAVKLFFFN